MTEEEFERLSLPGRITWVWKNTPSETRRGHVTIKELAARVGVSTQTVYDWKRPGSVREPDPENAEALAEVSGFRADLFSRPPGAALVTLEEIARRLEVLEGQVQAQGTLTTKSVEALARDLRALARRLGGEDGRAKAARS